jgi:acyl carrier protein
VTSLPGYFDDYLRIITGALPGPTGLDLTPDTMLSDLGFDSVALVQLVVQLEEALGVDLPEDALSAETFESVGSLWLVVSDLMASQVRP